MATPLPLLALTVSESYPFRRHPSFQSLLDNGRVLGYEVAIKRHIDGVAITPWLRIALIEEDAGIRWLSGVDAILQEEQTMPGITVAAFVILADLWCTVCPKRVFEAWYVHDPESDESISYARVFVTQSGFVVGTDNPEDTIEMQLEDVLAMLEDSETDKERAEAMADFDIGQIAAIALVQSEEPSAHERLVLTQKAKDTFDAWERAYPQWRAQGFDFCAPTA